MWKVEEIQKSQKKKVSSTLDPMNVLPDSARFLTRPETWLKIVLMAGLYVSLSKRLVYIRDLE